jgi:hypothetical protein
VNNSNLTILQDIAVKFGNSFVSYFSFSIIISNPYSKKVREGKVDETV